MDRVEAIIINAFQYENTQVMQPANNKSPTWWPKIVREYDPKKWATSPDPDSWPVDGVWELPKYGDIEIYNWVNEKIFYTELLTGNEKKILKLILGKGYKISWQEASKKLHCKWQEAKLKYEDIIYKIYKSLDPHELAIYFQKVV